MKTAEIMRCIKANLPGTNPGSDPADLGGGSNPTATTVTTVAFNNAHGYLRTADCTLRGQDTVVSK